uniref:Uncharacterized protein n=1 Tax=Nelumbo nucifera TaxID=4432 RepID=A0A822XYZ7_NELNU|nr:TPA_asm: hypothetical protein HUJ06_025773 [Nelumbo nucifera]
MSADVSFAWQPLRRMHASGCRDPPVEAQTKSKNGNFDAQEPTSSKVSCIGQIKNRKKMCGSNSKRVAPPPQDSRHVSVSPPRDAKKEAIFATSRRKKRSHLRHQEQEEDDR